MTEKYETVPGETAFDGQFNKQRGNDEITVKYVGLSNDQFNQARNYAVGYAGGSGYGLTNIDHEERVLTFRKVV